MNVAQRAQKFHSPKANYEIMERFCALELSFCRIISATRF